MTLSELCEPLFQYVCRLSRSARRGCSFEMDEVRSDIKRIFAQMKTDASAGAELTAQYALVELPLIFFVDFMIKESRLSFAADWVELARDKNELAGDEKFFDLLDETLADTSEAAAQRLQIFYTCIGLGFTGVYTGQSDSIRKLMSKMAARISSMMDADKKSFICPDAYENVDTRDFVKPAGTKLVGIFIALLGLIIVWCIAYFFLFRWTSDDVAKSLDRINANSSSVVRTTQDSTR